MIRHHGNRATMRKIPCTMSTQHPDNASLPSWASKEIIANEDEVFEAYYVFSELGCQEQMWDWEGKDVDPHIVRKLLTNHTGYFRENMLGRDIYLTYRVPNPSVEKTEKKILIEALESIPRCYDLAEAFYGKKCHSPVFEVILPFTTSHLELLRVLACYRTIVEKEEETVNEFEKVSMKSWVGEFKPKSIEVIPLIEDKKSMLNIENLLLNYLKAVKPNYLRVFLARSDPALNYGLFSAVLLVKFALSKMLKVSRKTNLDIFPIIGTGSLPFRGHLTPQNVMNFLEEYAGIKTVTIQSALKYDFSKEETIQTIKILNRELPKRSFTPMDSEEEKLLKGLIKIFTSAYQSKIEKLSGIINYIANFVPARRARKLHIGLFGYSRKIRRIKLPRAIPFTAALYSLGLPPELIGVNALTNLKENGWKMLEKCYLNWKEDLAFASQFLNLENLNCLLSDRELEKFTKRFGLKEVIREIIKDLEEFESLTGIKLGPRSLTHRKHRNFTNNVLISLAEGKSEEITKYIVEAGKIRRSLG